MKNHKLLTESSKDNAASFVSEYIKLCNRYSAEVVVNPFGVHTIVFDDGKAFAFKSVYPEWEEKSTIFA